MIHLKDFYDKKYSKISIYVIKTILMTFVLGMIIFHLAQKLGVAVNFISAILGPLVLGMSLAYILTPLVEWFERKLFSKIKKRRKKRMYGVLVTYVLIVILIVLILVALIATVTRSVSSIDFNDLVKFVETLEKDFSRFWGIVESKLAELNINLGSVGSVLSRIFNNVSSGLSTLLFANIFAIYFLLDSHIKKYWTDILCLFTSEEIRTKLSDFGKDADKVFSGYIRGQSIDALIIGVMVTLSLLVVGVPYAVVIGLLTGIGNLIPYVGPVVGFGSLIIVTLSEANLTHLLIGGIVMAIAMAIDGNIINPMLLSDNVEIHPVLVILALIAGGQIGGIIGMLIAVPVAALLKLQFDKFIERRKQQIDI